MKLLNFGSLNIDRVFPVAHVLRPGESMAAADPQIHAGGKGLNQSVAAARAGLSVFHAGKVGPDGLFLLQELEDAGVDTRYIYVDTEVPSGCAYIQVEPDGRNSMLICPGANHTLSQEQILKTLQDFSPGDLLLLQNETNLTAFLVEAAKSAGMKIAYNPSPITEAALSMDYSLIDLLLVNEDEAAALCGAKLPAKEALKKLCVRCPGIVVLTLGEQGAYGALDSTVEFVPACGVKAVDVTGAGDTFTGYLLWALADGQGLSDAMATASKAAALAVTRCGAADAIPTHAQVENAAF